jgi:hypothetical protein
MTDGAPQVDGLGSGGALDFTRASLNPVECRRRWRPVLSVVRAGCIGFLRIALSQKRSPCFFK